MSVKWVTLNSRLKDGISLINKVPTKKCRLLFTHIVNNSEKDAPFTVDELKKLAESLKFSESDVQLLVQSITYLFKQFTKVILKPTDLQKQLINDLDLDQEKAEEFVKLWSEETKKDVGDFEKRMKLENIAWEENLRICDQIDKQQKKAGARIQFNMSEAGDSSKKHDLVVELDKDELNQLYNTLEVIQIKLDNLQNVTTK